MNDAAQIAAPNAQHRRELLLCQDEVGGPCALDGREQPLSGALFERVAALPGDGLKDLRHEAIGIAREEVAQRRRAVLGIFQTVEFNPVERTANLHLSTREGRPDAPD